MTDMGKLADLARRATSIAENLMAERKRIIEILTINDCDIPACNCGVSHNDYRNRNTVCDLKSEIRKWVTPNQ